MKKERFRVESSKLKGEGQTSEKDNAETQRWS
jgi:hypothetical protein